MKKSYVSITLWGLAWMLLTMAQPAGATQVHAEPEGLYVHQIAHLFFIVSMGILIYWLREWKLVEQKGWRLVQYSSLFFILWNIDAMIVHYLDEQGAIFQTINAGTDYASLASDPASSGPALLYYLAKLDHLLCVPAIVFLYAGLRHLLQQAQAAKSSDSAS